LAEVIGLTFSFKHAPRLHGDLGDCFCPSRLRTASKQFDEKLLR